MPEVSPTDIAVVGRALRVPGARNVSEFWDNLCQGKESIRRLSDDELRARGVDPALLADPAYVKRGAPLEDLELFDAGFFGFSPREAAIMDPQHRHFLEVAWEALEDAGHPPESFPGRIGVFAGSGMSAYMPYHLFTNPKLMASVGLFLARHTGNDKDFLTTRASYLFDLRGPSVNIQTACSTSLVAIHAACQSLVNHECDLALAGGVTIELPHGLGYLYHEGEILSDDGHCRAFDRRAKGTVFGSGAGVVVLRRLGDALEDGDTVYAVVKGSAVNNDGGRKVGYLAPSVDGQAEAVAEALHVSGVPADSVTYVECHGTGTPVGDPIEVAGLTRAFRSFTDRTRFCAIGSVKTNIGHLDTAAGVASFVKVVEMLRHRTLAPSLHFREPNPEADWEKTPFFVADRAAPWPSDGPRRAGVNSLGVGGTNAHVVVEEAAAGAAAGALAWTDAPPALGADEGLTRAGHGPPRGSAGGRSSPRRCRRGLHAGRGSTPLRRAPCGRVRGARGRGRGTALPREAARRHERPLGNEGRLPVPGRRRPVPRHGVGPLPIGDGLPGTSGRVPGAPPRARRPRLAAAHVPRRGRRGRRPRPSCSAPPWRCPRCSRSSWPWRSCCDRGASRPFR